MIGKRAWFFFAAFFAILGSTYLVIKLAKGYKPDLSKKTFNPTGLLVATSIPDGAQIWLEGQLKSATNTTISLTPGTYEVKIKKDGFIPWKKALKIEKELVTKTDAYLFPQVPDLKALTFTGADNPIPSPDGTRIVYKVAGLTQEKNGLWVQELTDLPFGISREPRQILKSVLRGRDFSKSNYLWSPDSKQILVTLKGLKSEENFLIDPNVLTSSGELIDLTGNLSTILRQWTKEEKIRQDQKLKKLPPELLEILQNSASNIIFAPDETKILYTATASATIAENLIPKVPAASTQKQERTLIPSHTYVYDIKEDRNFLIIDRGDGKIEECKPKTLALPPSCSFTLLWFPTSQHLFFVEKERITIMEYDGTNRITVYSGPYEFPFAFPFPGANKLLILATLGKDLPLNLYAVSLR